MGELTEADEYNTFIPQKFNHQIQFKVDIFILVESYWTDSKIAQDRTAAWDAHSAPKVQIKNLNQPDPSQYCGLACNPKTVLFVCDLSELYTASSC